MASATFLPSFYFSSGGQIRMQENSQLLPASTTQDGRWVYTRPVLGSPEWKSWPKGVDPMRTPFTWIVALVATATMILAADNSLGTWKYNTAKSKRKGVSSAPISNLTVTREASDGGVKITAKGERSDGSKIDTVTNAKYDGKPVTVTGSVLTWDTVSIKQVNANTLMEERTKQGGKYHTTVRTVVSADGKTMTSTARGTGTDGKPVTITGVFDKQ